MTRKNLNVKEKMASLDTLSAGIVFGKEAAWDKLQARMDAKPAKRIPLKYWLAAAAMLLLCVTIVTIYNAPETQVARNEDNKEIKEKGNNIVVAQPAPPVTVQPALVAKQQNVTASNTGKQTTKLPVVRVQEIQPEIPSIQILPTPEVKPVTDEVSIVKTAEPLPVKKQMKVVHVNDLGNENDIPKNITIHDQTQRTANISKMKVVSLNDISGNEKETPEIKRINKPHNAALSFIKSTHTTATASGQNSAAFINNPINVKINLQN